MKPPSRDELATLGLDPQTALTLEAEASAPDDGVARGFASDPLDAVALAAHLASVTHLASFERTAARLGEPEAVIARADRRRGLYCLSLESLELVQPARATRDGEGNWIVDALGGRELVHVRGPGGDALLAFEGDAFAAYEVPREARSAVGAGSPREVPSAVAPEVDALLGGLDAPAWLTAPLARDTTDPYAVAAAVGAVGRLWSPEGGGDAREAMARLRRGDDPLSRARAWFAALPPQAREAALDLACVEADSLAAQLDTLTERVSVDLDAARVEALAWLERRDDLATLTSLLRAGELPAGLRARLASLDRAARTRATMWIALSPRSTPRLLQVSWQEPDAWWAEPARTA
ncbi:MAG: hypothetical protein R3A48_13695 [Polyangiales bacterium]